MTYCQYWEGPIKVEPADIVDTLEDIEARRLAFRESITIGPDETPQTLCPALPMPVSAQRLKPLRKSRRR